jgi:hypothetical protein
MTYLFQRFIRRYHRMNIVVSGLSTIDNCEIKSKNSLLHNCYLRTPIQKIVYNISQERSRIVETISS